MDRCIACDLSAGRAPLAGGRIHETTHWLVEHCVGPLGTGALIVKPRRHVTKVAELTDVEAAELGPLLRVASIVAGELVDAEQVYNCLWSHAGGRPVHIHYVIQPVTAGQMDKFGGHGPTLQVAAVRGSASSHVPGRLLSELKDAADIASRLDQGMERLHQELQALRQ